ncbi:hypothetical protein GCM10022252_74600 [Streptosporangium oxazolinicum]|uniref:Uncharacterized protein n=1 Tax=Streptosporangium oxazolinicum TaxID=909287 RepID=A0ABP8BKQ7_9ACTN
MSRKAEEEFITELWATTTTPRGAAWATAVGEKIHKTGPRAERDVSERRHRPARGTVPVSQPAIA